MKEQFEKTWSENVGGSRAVLLYSKEINKISVDRLESPKWTIKHPAALTIADVGIEIEENDPLCRWENGQGNVSDVSTVRLSVLFDSVLIVSLVTIAIDQAWESKC